MNDTNAAIDAAIGTVADETQRGLRAVRSSAGESMAAAVARIGSAPRVFVHGAGRSGLALKMIAMRLMHLGLDAYVVGETTTPAIRRGEVLLTASGSGTTGGVVRAAQTAVDVGATVIAISSTDVSPLSDLAAITIVIPSATKTDRSKTASDQYAGSLFEQSVLLLGDALFHAMWQLSGHAAEELWPRHANLE